MSESGGLGPNEVSLNGQIYRLVRGTMVQERNATSNAIVVRTGAEGLHDETATSAQAISDFSGGLGKVKGERGKDDNRFAYSQWDTRFNGQVTLPPLTTESLAWDGAPLAIIDFSSKTYAFGGSGGTGIRRLTTTTWQTYDTGTNGWVNSGGTPQTLTAAAISAIVFKSKLYILEGTAMDSYDGSTTWAKNIDSGRDGSYGCIYDDKLCVINPAGRLDSSTDGSTWVTGGSITTPTTITAMCLYFNREGEKVPHVGTSHGVYVYDFWRQKFYLLIDLSHRPSANNCLGMYSDGDVLYVPLNGGGMIEWRPGMAVHAGPNRDDGMPASYIGSIKKVIPMDGQIFAAHDAGTGTSTVLVKRGPGWSVHVEADAANESIKTLWYSSLTSPARLYFSQGNSIWYADEPSNGGNPLLDSAVSYLQSKIHTSCHMDFGRPHMTKLILSVTFLMENANANENISNIEYQTDYSGSWVTTGLSATTVTAKGSTEITFGSGVGTSCKTMAFRFTMTRGSTATNRPIYVSAVIKFVYIPVTVAGSRIPQSYAFWVDLAKTARYTGNSEEDLITNLDTAAKNLTLVAFYYGQSTTVQVVVRGLQKNTVLPKKGGSVASNRKGTVLVTVEEVL